MRRIDETLCYIQFMARHFDKSDVNAVAQAILCDLGITTKMDGFTYLRQAILIYHAWSVELAKNKVFPKNTCPFDAGDDRTMIDQAIRRCIGYAWDLREPEIWDLFFPVQRGKICKCPSNKEFISRISCLIELWQSCKEATYDAEK